MIADSLVDVRVNGYEGDGKRGKDFLSPGGGRCQNDLFHERIVGGQRTGGLVGKLETGHGVERWKSGAS